MLNELKKKIENKQVIKKSFFSDRNIDELLDMRDDKDFDSRWMKAYDILKKVDIRDHEKEIIDSIREKSYLVAYELSGSSDIAACVSDDFEIICKAYVSNYDEEWLNSLIMSYANGEFPCGKLMMTNYSISECMDSLLR